MTISGIGIINVVLIIMFQVNSRHHTLLLKTSMINLVSTLKTSPQTAVSRVSSRGSQATTSVQLVQLEELVSARCWSLHDRSGALLSSSAGGASQPPVAQQPSGLQALQSNSVITLGDIGYSWSNSPLELELSWAPEATVLGVEGVEWCPVGWLKGSCGSSYCGSSPSDGGSPSERYGGGGRSNQGGRLGERKKQPLLYQHCIMATCCDSEHIFRADLSEDKNVII